MLHCSTFCYSVSIAADQLELLLKARLKFSLMLCLLNLTSFDHQVDKQLLVANLTEFCMKGTFTWADSECCILAILPRVPRKDHFHH